MSKNLYARLAWVNIKNHKRLFIPFMLSCAGCIAMFNVMLTLMYNSFNIMSKGGASSVAFTIILGCYVVGFFSVFIVLYANSFIIKRRKKEFGLYNVLGMEKRHIARVMAVESLISSFASMIAGLAFSSLFSRLLTLILYKLIDIPSLESFSLSMDAALYTMALFAVIFLITYLWNVSRVGFSTGIELLRGGETGEREPKTKRIITILGVLTLGGGYYIAITTKEPALAILLFFVAVILVIIGTYCLFTAGSIALLKAMKKNKRYYYNPRHFTSVSGMIYRMKQNAVGLANICILSTMVMVMLSSTICLYSSMDQSIRIQFPRNLALTASRLNDDSYRDFSDYAKGEIDLLGDVCENKVEYRYVKHDIVNKNGQMTCADYSVEFINYSSLIDAYFIPLKDYVSLNPDGAAEFLEPDSVLIYSPTKPFDYPEVKFGDLTYSATALDDMYIDESFSPAGGSVMYIIVPEVNDLKRITEALEYKYDGYSVRFAFDVNCTDEEQVALSNEIIGKACAHRDEMIDIYNDSGVSIQCASSMYFEYKEVYGGLLFLGIFLGLMFTMATALIMYYRQISEGYEDSRRYEIMRGVGMSMKEIAGGIRSQVVTVFLLPLAAAGLHIAFAFPLIMTMFKMLRLTNVALFTNSTLICLMAFGLIYMTVYALTARTYYRIVSRPAV